MDYKEQTIAEYDKQAATRQEYYKKNATTHRTRDYETFYSLLHGKKVLDVGCGPGADLENFKEHGLQAQGIDLSDAMIHICEEKHLRVQKMDLEELAFEAASFDGVWMCASLLHTPKKNAPRIIESIAKILKAGGVLFISVKIGEGEGFVQDEGMKRFFSFWTEQELRTLTNKHFEYCASYEQPGRDRPWIKYFARKKNNG